MKQYKRIIPASNKTYVDLNKTYVGEAKFISKKQ